MRPKHTILWADDDIDDRELFREVLEAVAPDYKVIEFPNGKELLSYLHVQEAANFPCLIILDLNMPVLGGRETLSALKADLKLKNIPVAIFTTSIIPQDKDFCERINVTTFTKPSCYIQLKSAIRRLINLCQKVETT